MWLWTEKDYWVGGGGGGRRAKAWRESFDTNDLNCIVDIQITGMTTPCSCDTIYKHI